MAEAAGAFVTRSFERMLKDSGGRKHANLQKALKAYLDRSTSSDQASSSSLPMLHSEESTSHNEGVSFEAEKSMTGTESSMSDQHHSSSSTGLAAAETLSKAGHTLEGSEAELVLLPLRLAFETNQHKIVETALDCLHKLISYEHLEGDAGWEAGKNASMLTEMFNLVCDSAEHNVPDSTTLQVMKVLLTAIASNQFQVHGECLLRSIRVCYNIVLTSKSSVNQATAKGTLTQMISIVFKRMESEKKEEEMNLDGKQTSQSENLDSSSIMVPDNKFGDCVAAATPMNDLPSHLLKTPEMDLAQVVQPVSVEEIQNLAGDANIKGLEAALVKAGHPEGGEKAPEGLDLESMTLAQRDALLVFRTICKMSMKEERDDVANRTKILSLDLLQGLLENVNHSFSADFHFIDSVKAYLCYALLRACLSSTASIFQLATSIFCILLLRFRESLKGEIGVFFPLIVLRSLDSSDSPLHQRMAVLRMLEKACKDPQMIADVFVNYDCDLEAVNLFERMVNSLSRMTQGTLSSDPSNITLSQNISVKVSSLQCLVNVLKSLVDWAVTHESVNQIVGVTAMLSDQVLGRHLENDSLRNNYIEEKIQAEQFEKAKAHKSTLEAVVAEFNRKPEKGIEYVVASKLADQKPTSIAQFLLSTPGLDKCMIGEYLGQHEEFPLAVMHAYVNAINFEGMKFDVAIREFLKGFRLPGEAQKIDRIMEKFAERYCHDNPGLFRSADAAYVLAYAVIMLNTDAHNPMVWPKMSKADFIRINSGSEAEEGAPRELLEEIYGSIVKNEIKLKDEDHLPGKGVSQKQDSEERSQLVRILNLGLPRRKVSVDTKKESEGIVRQIRDFFKRGVRKIVFHKAKQMELVKPMLEAVGWPLLAAFSVTMEDTDNKTQVMLCLEGFQLGIHLTKLLCMDTMRYALLTSLVRFTFLHAPKEMRSKNAEALRTLLGLSETEPDALQDTWNAVLECISRLEYISGNSSIAMTLMQGSNQVSRDALVQLLNELTGKPAEQVFVNSVKLPSDTIVEFFTALCGVSSEELKQVPPRVFSLQKLVEISYYNMSRIRMVWGRIWLVLAQHFVSAGSHHDEQIAMYAIDSLRQLGIKYLERAELANFTFQNDILKPFVIIIRNSQSGRIRELIVDCIIQMIKSKVGSIKSGWRSVFMVFKAAASDTMESIIELSFENMEQVILEHFDQVVGDCFMDCVHCLIAFANSKSFSGISLKSIALLRICEDRLAEGLIPGGASKPIQINDNGAEEVAEHYWFPMLVGLSDLTCDPRPEVRDCALEVLFDLLKERGHKFSPSFWENVFRDVLFPIFDHVRNAGKDSQQLETTDSWLQQTCIHSLQLLCDLFSTFYKEVSFVLPSLLGLLLDCATRPDQRVASISINALMHLTEVGGHQFSESDWSTLLSSIRDACYTTQPVELLNSCNSIHSGLQYTSSRRLSGLSDAFQADHLQSGESFEEEISDGDGFDNYDNGYTLNGTPTSAVNEDDGKINAEANYDWDVERQEFSSHSESEEENKSTSEGFFRNQTFGKKLMGNMMDNFLLKSLTFKGRGQPSYKPASSSPEKVTDGGDQAMVTREQEILVSETVRSKCVIQLLFLSALDSLQRKHWVRLQPSHKVVIMDILLSMADFAASYNSYQNLKIRMQQFPDQRPPINLLRQEIEGSTIYITILQKEISEQKSVTQDVHGNGFVVDVETNSDSLEMVKVQQGKLMEATEHRLVSFCGHILKEAADMQPGNGDAVEDGVHYVFSLRSPVLMKVLNGLSKVENNAFKKIFPELYPYFMKLICCEQVDVRRALGDLFKAQFLSLVP